jgi:hypothetical protein
MTLWKSFDDLSEGDLVSLVNDEISEKRTIEYKRELPSNADESKKEFVADISSFANAAGGHLVFGIPEENGLPTAVVGVPCENPDQVVLRLENLIRDGLEPRIQGVLAKGIRLSSGQYAFVFRIPRSWSKPHAVNYRGHWRFYSRNSAGKYPLDVSELRSAFVQAGALGEQIRLFRDGRLGSIIADQLPARIIPGARVILHVVPYAAFEPAAAFPFEEIANNPLLLAPIDGPVTDYRYNFDGFITTTGNEAGLSRGYVQVFRNGIIEAVDGTLLRDRPDGPIIPSSIFEKELIQAVRCYLEAQKRMTVPMPNSVMLSLVGVSGYVMAVAQRLHSSAEDQHPIDRDTLAIPEIVLESFPTSIEGAMKPAFDAVWNATGWASSLGYNDKGEWGKGPNFSG